jgi:hypothetical protein
MLFWLFFGRAAAQPAPKLRTVVVTSEDGPPLDEGLLSALRELFARVGIELVDSDEGKDEGLLARVRIQRDVDAATVRVFSVTDKRLASTHRVPRGETEALFRETLAHVVLGAVEPLVVERVEVEAKLPAQETAAPAPAPPQAGEPTKPDAGRALHFAAGLGAGPLALGDLWAPRIFGRADAYVATRMPSVFGLTLGGIVPLARTAASTEAELSLFLVRVQSGIEPWRSRFVRLGLLLAAGANFIATTANPQRAALDVVSPSRRVDALLGGLVQLRFPLWWGLELEALVGCDVDLTPRSFVVRDGEHRTKLFPASHAQPYAGLLVAWSSL